ncbi:MAG: helix-turn-helix domain-containing protein [Cellvibrionaceae bacterium]
MQNDFCLNLRLLCSYYRSIADVCRRLDFNRSQFNRYLNGRSRPSPNTLRQICSFFGVSEQEIHCSHEEFKHLVQPVSENTTPDTHSTSLEQTHLSTLEQQNSQQVEKYLGYYYEYYYSMTFPGKILKTLICIEQKDGKVYYQRTERVGEKNQKATFYCKYFGMMHCLSDRIFMNDFESMVGNEITQTILYPSFNNKVNYLTGLRLGVSSNSERVPCCTRVVLEYLGKSIEILRALKNCHLYETDDPLISNDILGLIDNKNEATHLHFRARM